jgi:hypothetical protein
MGLVIDPDIVSGDEGDLSSVKGPSVISHVSDSDQTAPDPFAHT